MSSPATVSTQIAGHITDSIAKASLVKEPFPYLVTDNALPPDIFARLIADLPAISDLKPMSQIGLRNVAKYDKHVTALFEDIPGRRDPDVWAHVASALLDMSVENLLREIFSPFVPVARDRRDLIREVRLDCGQAGAFLEPHTDSPVVLMKSLLHLSPETSHSTADTVLFRPKDPDARRKRLGERGDFSPASYAHESAGDHVEAARVKFRPNRMWSFFRTADSLHGLEPLAEAATPRYIVAAHYRFVHA